MRFFNFFFFVRSRCTGRKPCSHVDSRVKTAPSRSCVLIVSNARRVACTLLRMTPRCSPTCKPALKPAYLVWCTRRHTGQRGVGVGSYVLPIQGCAASASRYMVRGGDSRAADASVMPPVVRCRNTVPILYLYQPLDRRLRHYGRCTAPRPPAYSPTGTHSYGRRFQVVVQSTGRLSPHRRKPVWSTLPRPYVVFVRRPGPAHDCCHTIARDVQQWRANTSQRISAAADRPWLTSSQPSSQPAAMRCGA